jgi:hypothetical protein
MGWLVLVSIQRKTASRTAAANDPLGGGPRGMCPRRAAPGGGDRTSGFETAMAAVLPASVRSRSQCERRYTADHGDERVLARHKRSLLAVLERAADRGQVRPEAASPLVAEVGVAMVVQRFLVDGPPVPDDYVVSVLDEVLMPPLRPSSAGDPVDPGPTRSCRG